MKKNKNKEISLPELSTKSGVPPRTIRLYISRGLLPRPLRGGKTAAYGPEHLEMLKQIRSFQKKGLTLDQIRQSLTGDVDSLKLPAPERWLTYHVTPDVNISIRADASPWRLKLITDALHSFSKQINLDDKED